MADYDKGKDNAKGSRFSQRWMLWREWPYFVMPVLALSGSPIRISHGRR